ncbi:Fic family protein [Chitinophagaceae bacterium LWZ2-11]
MLYNWQQKDWPHFTYDLTEIEDQLFEFAERVGHITGIVKALPDDTQMEAIIETMVSEAIKTSEIEGEYLNRKDVMSSIRNNLGLNTINEPVADKKAAGVAQLMIDVRNTYQQAMTKEQLFTWHKMLLGTNTRINTGQWRMHKDPMQVISGSIGKEKIHFEAPASEQVPKEMDRFINWLNETAPGGNKEIKKAPVRSAIAHLYFESIHPFEDGNGRIGRAIAEKTLSQGVGRPVLLSLSRTIEANKKAYYHALEMAQKNNEVTAWIKYFTNVIVDAQRYAEDQIDFSLNKAKFFDRLRGQLNERQLKVIKRILEEGPAGFEGGISASKYATLTKTSKATATRDLQDLLEKGAIIFFDESGGRSTRYKVNV